MAKKVTRTAISFDQKYLGREPVYDGEVLTQIKLIRALNWYNHFKQLDDSKEYIVEYCKLNKIKINVSTHKSTTHGWLARILTQGGKLPESTQVKFNDYITKLKSMKAAAVEAKAAEPVTEEKEVNRLGIWMPDFEEAIDKYKESFDTYSYIRSHNIPQIYVKQIAERYQGLLEELEIAYAKTNDQVNEAYRGYTRTDLKALRTRVQSIIEDANRYVGNVKKERKPRKKKVKSTEAILKHFKCQQRDDKLKLVSEDPSKIIGATALYALNTKYNTLTVFVAKDATGLSVNRTAITNFDEKQSQTKRVGRKLTEVINAINNGTKRTRPKVLELVKSDAIRFTDRINENTLILKVDK